MVPFLMSEGKKGFAIPPAYLHFLRMLSEQRVCFRIEQEHMYMCKFTGIFYSVRSLIMAVGCFIQENRDRHPKSGA
jgi:hypothetical protein